MEGKHGWTDRQMDGETDRQTDGQADGSDFTGHFPTDVEHPKMYKRSKKGASKSTSILHYSTKGKKFLQAW